MTTLGMLTQTFEATQEVYPIQILTDNPLLLEAGINVFANTLHDDNDLTSDEVADIISKTFLHL